ncbi:LuxR C-terminal-related transcriptional regulator [Dactylosporangium sp. CA-233914]|uniref:LuxR C-terminal-related transcriptional regulator n=1 Tax=Dactylosporangium sp. CA-233914 TaxID=3239934 RepID=UPI003D91C419
MTAGLPGAPGGRPPLRRPRLASALDTGLDVRRRRPIAAVYGPAGAGKTTALLDWLARLPRPAAVLYLEVAEANTAHVRSSPGWAGARVAGAGRATPAWLGVERPAGSARIPLQEIAGFIAGLSGTTTTDQPPIVVVDGIERATNARALRGLLGSLTALDPADRGGRPRARLVVSGRSQRQLDAVEDIAPSVTTVLSPDELRLTSGETAQLCAQRGLELEPDALRRLYAITGGWAAGLSVVIDTLQYDRHDPHHQLDEALRTGAGLDAYVRNEVLAGFPRDARDALQAASILASFDAELFTAVTGVPDSHALLDALAEHERCLVELAGGSGWYRIPRLWRAALHFGLSTTAPDRVRDLHRAAATWYTEHGQPDEGRSHAAEALGEGPTGRLAAAPHPPERRSDPRPGPALTDAALARAWLALRAGEPGVARRHLLAAPTGTAAARIEALADCLAGRLHAAARTAAGIQATLHRQGTADSGDEGWALLTLAAVAVLRGHAEQAHRRLDELLVQNWPPEPSLQAGAVFHRLQIESQTGHVGVALTELERLIAEEADTLVLPAWAPRALRIDLLLGNGLLHDAQRRLDSDAARFPPVVAAITAAKLVVAGPATQPPAGAVERLLHPFLDDHPPCLAQAVELQLLLATAARQSGDTRRADRCTHRAIALARPEELRSPFITTRLIDRQHRTGTPSGAPSHSATPAVTGDAPPDPPATAHSHPDNTATLTEAEAGVLHMLVGFLTVAEIAETLHLSPNTVKTHLTAIYGKLGVHRRRDAIRRARDLGLL